MQEYAIIVAGGSGSRMKSDIPKQFLEVNGLPILFHTLRAFRNYSEHLNIILVLPAGQFSFWEELCIKHQINIEYQLVAGGETRFHSVRNGLNSINSQDGIVAVHDGVRPVISREVIASGFQKAAQSGTAVTSVALKDSIRVINPDETNTAQDRNLFRLIQTPQTFRLDWMRKAFSAEYEPMFTDCASVLEAAGYDIHLIEGAYENIKVTTPEDLQWAGIYLQADKK